MSDIATKVQSALGKFADAIQALVDAGIITGVDQLASMTPAPAADTPAPAAETPAPAAETPAPAAETPAPDAGATEAPTASTAQATPDLVSVARDPLIPVKSLPRGAGGRFLPRGGTTPETNKAKTPKTPKTPKVVIPVAPKLVDDFVNWFFSSPKDKLYAVKRGQYEVRLGSAEQGTAHVLIFNSKVKQGWGPNSHIKAPENANNVVGIRPLDSEIGVFNASALLYSTSRSAQKRPQIAAEAAGAVPIPFQNVVARSGGAGLDLTKLQIVDWKGSERMIIPPVSRTRQWQGDFYVVDRHFAGAMVIRVEDRYFLFDTDREEAKHFGFNPFFTQLPGPAASVEEAYKLLMPEEVQKAAAEGRDVKRQGEFFFIPLTSEEVIDYRYSPDDYRRVQISNLFGMAVLEQRLLNVAAAYYNWLQTERYQEVTDFLARCKEHNAGLLPENSAGASERLAEEILQPLIDQLTLRVGSDLAQGKHQNLDVITQAIKDRQIHGRNSGLTYTHLSEEARTLADACRADIDQASRHATPQGQVARDYGIMFNLRIGEAAEANSWRQRQHRATAVMEPKPGIVLALGTVVHEGREHRPVFLDTWHKVVGNTATNNWTVSGDVD